MNKEYSAYAYSVEFHALQQRAQALRAAYVKKLIKGAWRRVTGGFSTGVNPAAMADSHPVTSGRLATVAGQR